MLELEKLQKDSRGYPLDKKVYQRNLDRKGFVYFAQVGTTGPIKIGFTGRDPVGRIKSFQENSPHRLRWIGMISGSRMTEAQLHAGFSKERLRGEWFRATKRLLTFIQESCPDFCGKDADESIFHCSFISEVKRTVGKDQRSRDLWEYCLQQLGFGQRNDIYRWFAREKIPSSDEVERTKAALGLYIKLSAVGVAA